MSLARIGALIVQADTLHERGRLVEAEAIYRQAAGVAPRVPEIQFGWATVLADLGRLPEAERVYRGLLALTPGFAEAHVNLGIVLRDLRRLDQAVPEFERALRLKPDVAYALPELVSVLSALGRPRDAVNRASEAMRRSPGSSEARRAFASTVARGAKLDYSEETSTFLERCLAADDVEHDNLAKACAWQLRQKYQIDPAPALAAGHVVDAAIAGNAAGCLSDPLLLRMLATVVNTDRELELFLTEIRRRLLPRADLPASLNPFLAALAIQCFDNGYVFSVSADEAAHVEALRAELGSALVSPTMLDPGREQELLRLAFYEPLAALEGAPRLLDAAVPSDSPFGIAISRCIAEPLESAALARDIPSFGPIEDAVSLAVRAQYEEHPYPRWRSMPPVSPIHLPAMLQRKFPDAPIPSFLEGPIDVLVAGSGTGRQPITTALSIANSRVLAVDLSRASLAWAKRMALLLGASNASFLQADLLNLRQLKRDFAVVEAVGVLHHLSDPIAGWRVLCDVLRPGGFMLVGLYSRLARREVVAAREHIARAGIAATPGNIRSFRHSVLFGEERQRFPDLALSKDLYDLSGCRDLLFHVQEHRYSLPELGSVLPTLGLEFLGFDHLNEQAVCGYQKEMPDRTARSDLASWARFEEAHPEAFSGMYLFWCRKGRP